MLVEHYHEDLNMVNGDATNPMKLSNSSIKTDNFILLAKEGINGPRSEAKPKFELINNSFDVSEKICSNGLENILIHNTIKAGSTEGFSDTKATFKNNLLVLDGKESSFASHLGEAKNINGSKEKILFSKQTEEGEMKNIYIYNSNEADLAKTLKNQGFDHSEVGSKDDKVKLRHYRPIKDSFALGFPSVAGVDKDALGDTRGDNEGKTVTMGAVEKVDDTFTVTFEAGKNGKLEGQLVYEGIEENMTWDEAGISIPKTNSNSGYRFSKWSPGLPKSDYKITKDLLFTAEFTRKSSSGGGGGGGSSSGGGNSKTTPELNREEHYSYIVGYTDGNFVRPESYISREEVATVFYRLLEQGYKNQVESSSNQFLDVDSSRWSNKPISTLENANILRGYIDGNFKPENPITRAEAAAISSRFSKQESNEKTFLDIKGHWAESSIRNAAGIGWVNGYEDGTFRPDNYITRAEFVSLVNSVLERKVKSENILEGIKKFDDLEKGKWYYEAMVEAINGHEYERLEDGTERWKKLVNKSFK